MKHFLNKGIANQDKSCFSSLLSLSHHWQRLKFILFPLWGTGTSRAADAPGIPAAVPVSLQWDCASLSHSPSQGHTRFCNVRPAAEALSQPRQLQLPLSEPQPSPHRRGWVQSVSWALERVWQGKGKQAEALSLPHVIPGRCH